MRHPPPAARGNVAQEQVARPAAIDGGSHVGFAPVRPLVAVAVPNPAMHAPSRSAARRGKVQRAVPRDVVTSISQPSDCMLPSSMHQICGCADAAVARARRADRRRVEFPTSRRRRSTAIGRVRNVGKAGRARPLVWPLLTFSPFNNFELEHPRALGRCSYPAGPWRNDPWRIRPKRPG